MATDFEGLLIDERAAQLDLDGMRIHHL